MIKEILRTLFKIHSSPADKVTDFSDAYDWIITYKKAREYDTAIMAARELLLKIKSGITYFTSAEKKITVLASSNIESIAKAAKSKGRTVERHLKHLHTWETQVRKLIETCEELRIKKQEKDEELRIHAQVMAEIAVINGHITKKEFPQALHLAKKLAAAHYTSKEATDTLIKTQKLFDSKINKKEESLKGTQRRLERFFRESGIKNGAEAAEKTNVAPKNGFKEKFRALFDQISLKQREHREYLKRQKALRTIEQLLVESGSITKITDEEGNEELFSIMENGLTKDINNFSIDGYNFFGKIIGKDKIVGDTFGFHRDGTRTVFYFGDATGHGVQAGFTVSLLTKIFFEYAKKVKNFVELFKTLNNELKAKLKGRVFVTGVFMEHDSMAGTLKFIGAGHDPMYIYHAKTREVEKIIPGGLALGVRNISNVGSIKVRDMILEDGDILVGYTDGIIEARNAQNELYGLTRLENALRAKGKESEGDINRLYDLLYKDVKEFQGNTLFLDDVSFFIFKRDSSRDLITEKAELDKLLEDLDMSQRTVKVDYKGKTRAEVAELMQKERHAAELKARLANLDQLYKI